MEPDDLELQASAASTGAEAEQVVELASLELEKYRDGDGRDETLSIPASVRAEVMGRDQNICRFCGSYAEHPALHHVVYRSQGGKHHPDNLISVHWMYSPRCHEKMHGSKARLWRPLGLQVVKTPGVTILQLMRWQQVRERKQR